MAPIALWDFDWLPSHSLMLFGHGICIHFVCVHDILYEKASSIYVVHTIQQYKDEVNTIIGAVGLARNREGGGGGWPWKNKLIMYSF